MANFLQFLGKAAKSVVLGHNNNKKKTLQELRGATLR